MMAKRTIIEARNPAYINAEETIINLEVKFAEVVDNGAPIFLPFTASLSDSEPHGRDLFLRAEAGEFGEITPYSED